MPVIPSGSDFPPQQGNSDNNAPNQDQRNSDQGTQKATMLDHLSKGPQIPDSKSALCFYPHNPSTLWRFTKLVYRHATQSPQGRDRGTHEGTE